MKIAVAIFAVAFLLGYINAKLTNESIPPHVSLNGLVRRSDMHLYFKIHF